MTARGPAPATLRGLADRFDAFLVDQFGVLHDGRAAYAGAIDALAHLKAAGKRIVVVSNSGKRAAPNIDRLLSLGFARDSVDLVLTSGELAWDLLANGMIGDAIPAGGRCLLLARDDDRSAIAGLDLTEAGDGRDADLVLLSGSRGDDWPMDAYEALLAPAAERGVPCLCTNPDKVMLTATGRHFGAGAIADAYIRLGGPVTWIGKPYPEIFRAALIALGDPAPASVCCIGDSVEHDIAGAAVAGLGTALVRSGIHADADDRELSRLFDLHGATPDHVIARFEIAASEVSGPPR